MTIKEEHPCAKCKYFYGWHDVEAELSGVCSETIFVDIPICNRVLHILALYRCKYYKEEVE